MRATLRKEEAAKSHQSSGDRKGNVGEAQKWNGFVVSASSCDGIRASLSGLEFGVSSVLLLPATGLGFRV